LYAVVERPAASLTESPTVYVPRPLYVCETPVPEPLEPSPKDQEYPTIPVSSVDVEIKLHDIREQFAVNDATGAAFVGVVVVGGGGGG
jgi:hypothetical protein